MKAKEFDKKFDDNKILTSGAINLKPTSPQPLSPLPNPSHLSLTLSPLPNPLLGGEGNCVLRGLFFNREGQENP
jgi:hypothetical protein